METPLQLTQIVFRLGSQWMPNADMGGVKRADEIKKATTATP